QRQVVGAAAGGQRRRGEALTAAEPPLRPVGSSVPRVTGGPSATAPLPTRARRRPAPAMSPLVIGPAEGAVACGSVTAAKLSEGAMMVPAKASGPPREKPLPKLSVPPSPSASAPALSKLTALAMLPVPPSVRS